MWLCWCALLGIMLHLCYIYVTFISTSWCFHSNKLYLLRKEIIAVFLTHVQNTQNALPMQDAEILSVKRICTATELYMNWTVNELNCTWTELTAEPQSANYLHLPNIYLKSKPLTKPILRIILLLIDLIRFSKPGFSCKWRQAILF